MSIAASHGLVAIALLALTGAAYLVRMLARLEAEESRRRQALEARWSREFRATPPRPGP